MRTVIIAIGNPLRGDDGIAHLIVDRLAARPGGIAVRHVHQLTPEVAAEIAEFDRVIFVDADPAAAGVLIQPLSPCPSAAAFTHVARPSDVIALAERLYGFAGKALLCRVPAADMSAGTTLTGVALARAEIAVDRITDQSPQFMPA